MKWYKCSLCDIFRPDISRIDDFVVKRVFNYSTVSSLQQAINFLRECIKQVSNGSRTQRSLTQVGYFTYTNCDQEGILRQQLGRRRRQLWQRHRTAGTRGDSDDRQRGWSVRNTTRRRWCHAPSTCSQQQTHHQQHITHTVSHADVPDRPASPKWLKKCGEVHIAVHHSCRTKISTRTCVLKHIRQHKASKPLNNTHSVSQEKQYIFDSSAKPWSFYTALNVANNAQTTAS